MARERAGGQRCDTCTEAFKASGKTSWRLSKWNFEMAVVFTTWRVYALPLFLSLMASICPVVPVSWASSWQSGGPDAAPGASTVGMLYWWLLMQGYIMAPGLGRKSAAMEHQGGPCSPQWHAAVSYSCFPERFAFCLVHLYSGLHSV